MSDGEKGLDLGGADNALLEVRRKFPVGQCFLDTWRPRLPAMRPRQQSQHQEVVEEGRLPTPPGGRGRATGEEALWRCSSSEPCLQRRARSETSASC